MGEEAVVWAASEEVELMEEGEVKEEVVVDGFLDQNILRHNNQLLQVVSLCWDL